MLGVLPYKAAIEVAGFGRKVRLQGFLIIGEWLLPRGKRRVKGENYNKRLLWRKPTLSAKCIFRLNLKRAATQELCFTKQIGELLKSRFEKEEEEMGTAGNE